MEITVCQEVVRLLPDHALFLVGERTLVLCDVHLGKAATFQAHGMPIPEGDDLYDLDRMRQLVEGCGAEHLVIAGDLLHAPSGTSDELVGVLEAWGASLPARVTLVIGNHDVRALSRMRLKGLEQCSLLQVGPFTIVHEAEDVPAEYDGVAICGHIHPVVRIRDGKRTKLRLPCFHLSDGVLTLPAFGSFTGGQPIRSAPEDVVYAIVNGRVMKIPEQMIC